MFKRKVFWSSKANDVLFKNIYINRVYFEELTQLLKVKQFAKVVDQNVPMQGLNSELLRLQLRHQAAQRCHDNHDSLITN